MSWQAQAWVWTLELPPSVKLLALSLANYADPTGKRIMPGHERVIAETGLSPASLKRGIATLVEAGHLHVTVQSTGRGYRNEYEMPVDMQAVSAFHEGKGVHREPLRTHEPGYVTGKGAHHEPNTPDNDAEGDHHEPYTVPKRAQAEPLPDEKRGSNDAKKGLKSSKEGAHHEPPIPRVLTLENNPRVRASRVSETVSPMVPLWMPLEAWNGFLDMRRRNRKTPTARAIGLLIGELDRLRLAGDDPADVLDQSTVSGWTGVFPLRSSRGGGSTGSRISNWQALGDELDRRAGRAH